MTFWGCKWGIYLNNVHGCERKSTSESFHVIRPNLLKVRAQTDPDLPNLIIFYVSRPD